jgi:hypothetical protein
MKKWIKIIFVILIIGFIGIQFVRPDKKNPVTEKARDITSFVHVPAEVMQVIEHSCYDCHSNFTHWPWYSNIAPVSWLVANDVSEGRDHMNFSEWDKNNITDHISFLDDICKEVKKGDMPLGKYTILHPDAKLSDADKQLLCKWANAASDSLMGN